MLSCYFSKFDFQNAKGNKRMAITSTKQTPYPEGDFRFITYLPKESQEALGMLYSLIKANNMWTLFQDQRKKHPGRVECIYKQAQANTTFSTQVLKPFKSTYNFSGLDIKIFLIEIWSMRDIGWDKGVKGLQNQMANPERKLEFLALVAKKTWTLA